jgi:hypothetical protein
MDATRLDATRCHKKLTEELQEESRPFHFLLLYQERLNVYPLQSLLLTLCATIRTDKERAMAQPIASIIIPLIIILPLIVFWLWMAWDLGGNDNLSRSEKFYWQLAFIFMNVFAAVFYYIYEYRKRR